MSSKKKIIPASAPKRQIKPTLFESIEKFCFDQQKIILIVSCLLSLLLALLLFNPDVSVGGDDSAYIMDSYNLLHGIKFPTWQGPFYPIIMVPFIAVFGVNLIVLKLLSVFCWVASVFFTFKLLARIANFTIASFVSILASISLMLNIYASSTYSEPLFMLLQAIFLGFLMYLISNGSTNNYQKKYLSKDLLLKSLGLAIVTYALYQTRSVAIIAVPFAIIVLLIERKYILSALFFCWTAIVHVLWGLYRNIVWDTASVSFSGQLNNAFLKNFYKASEGTEDFWGLVQRFWDNSNLYLSKHLSKMTGLIPYSTFQISQVITIFIYILVIVAFIVLWKKHKKSCYTILYISAMIGATFILLQKTWDQERLIMIYFPIVLGFVTFAIHTILNKPSLKNFQWVFLLISIILLISMSKQTIFYFDKDYKIKHRFESGLYESYTQDWQNYMLASKWAGDNLPDSAVVACRKMQMSWIASGGKNIFKGINRVPSTNPDTLIMNMKKLGATHVIMGNLRINPKIKTNRTINTIRNTLFYITLKKPAAFEPIKTFGSDEQAHIFKINFSDNLDNETIISNLDAGLIINPKNKNICLTKADYFFRKNEFEKGLWYINFALTQYPKDATLFFSQGIGYFQLHDWEKANTSFDNSIKYDANNSNAWYNKAISLYNLGKYPESKKALSQAKQLGYREVAELEKMLNNF